MAPSVGKMRKRYSDVADRQQGNVPYDNTMDKLFVKSKTKQSAKYTTTLLKSKVNPIQTRSGMDALKTLKNGQLLLESERKSELEEVCKK